VGLFTILAAHLVSASLQFAVPSMKSSGLTVTIWPD